MSEGITFVLKVRDDGTATIDKAGKGFDKLDRDVKKTDASAKKLGGSFGGLKTAVIGLIGALGLMKLARVVGDWEKLTAVQDKAEAQMRQVMVSMGRFTEANFKAAKSLASAIQATTTFGDEAVMNGMKFLMTYKQITDDLLPRTTRAMVDFAALSGKGLEAAANTMGKAAMGMTGQLALSGITISEVAKKSKDFSLILRDIEEQVKGQGQAIAELREGQLLKFGNTLGDIKEKLGETTLSMKALVAKSLFGDLDALNNKLAAMKEAGQFDIWAKDMAVGVISSIREILIAVGWLHSSLLGVQEGMAAIRTAKSEAWGAIGLRLDVLLGGEGESTTAAGPETLLQVQIRRKKLEEEQFKIQNKLREAEVRLRSGAVTLGPPGGGGGKPGGGGGDGGDEDAAGGGDYWIAAQEAAADSQVWIEGVISGLRNKSIEASKDKADAYKDMRKDMAEASGQHAKYELELLDKQRKEWERLGLDVPGWYAVMYRKLKIQAMREGDSLFQGMKAGVLELMDEFKTFGEFGADWAKETFGTMNNTAQELLFDGLWTGFENTQSIWEQTKKALLRSFTNMVVEMLAQFALLKAAAILNIEINGGGGIGGGGGVGSQVAGGVLGKVAGPLVGKGLEAIGLGAVAAALGLTATAAAAGVVAGTGAIVASGGMAIPLAGGGFAAVNAPAVVAPAVGAAAPALAPVLGAAGMVLTAGAIAYGAFGGYKRKHPATSGLFAEIGYLQAKKTGNVNKAHDAAMNLINQWKYTPAMMAELGYDPVAQYAQGGLISEPVIGTGLNTGKTYSIGEQGPEWVTPVGGKGPGSTVVFNIGMMTTDDVDRWFAARVQRTADHGFGAKILRRSPVMAGLS